MSDFDTSVLKNNDMEPSLAPDMEVAQDLGKLLSQAFAVAGDAIHANKVDKGWTITTPEKWALDDNQVPADLALIHSEVSEALEAFRNDESSQFVEELADIMIRVIGLANGLGMNLGIEIARKIESNRRREFKHGGKRV